MLVRAFLRVVSISAAAAFALALSFAPAAARAAEETESPTSPTIYKWVDENGISHYTTDRGRIPSEIRDRVESRGEVATTNPAAPAQPAREDLMRDAVRKKPVAGTSTAPIAAPTAAAATAASAVPAPNPGAAAAPAPEAATVAMPAPGEGAEVEVTEIQQTTEVEAVAVEQAPVATEIVEEAPIEEAPAPQPTQIAAPAPLSQDVQDEVSAVSAPPPAPAAPIDPDEQAQLSELDSKIEAVQGEIAQREETLASLISTSDEQRTTPLVDDPQFREISQTLPKLQADLQTLRERRNKIQPTAATP
jgi:hypothetical protein